MRLAIADPPYLGRAARWYGDGQGIGGYLNGQRRDHRADYHPDAAEWDDPARHVALVAELEASFDGWAIAATPSSLSVYLPACPPDTRVLVWRRRNAPPSGSRIRGVWEPVVTRVPPSRRGRTGPRLDDVLDVPAPRASFAGAKPPEWTRWVLDALGYDPDTDDLVDLFPGSGAVAREAAQGVIL